MKGEENKQRPFQNCRNETATVVENIFFICVKLMRFSATHTINFFITFLSFSDASVFRERARLPPHNRRQQQAELAERFLKAIEEEREKEREEEYRDELKNLWNRYQKEEINIERELFNENDENDIESDYPLSYQDDIARKKKKRQVSVLSERHTSGVGFSHNS